jgi:hypothetical protein
MRPRTALVLALLAAVILLAATIQLLVALN